MATIMNIVKLYSEKGIQGIITLKRNINSDNAHKKMDGRAEARIIEIACAPAPAGHSRWTLRLLEEQAKVVLDVPVSKDTIGRAKKNRLRPHMNNYWCIPSKNDADFVACMEDVLDVYKAFPPAEARRIIKRLEIHYTPKHGSWLDMAEIELNVMTRQCLSCRIASIEKLKCELSAWEAERNCNTAKIQWHFQTEDAREKLISLYPALVSFTS